MPAATKTPTPPTPTSPPQTADGEWHLIATVAVDSGQLIVVDPYYIEKGLDYDGVCKANEKPLAGTSFLFSGMGGIGAVFSSGFGDGSYEVWSKVTDAHGDWGQRVSEVRIVMIGADEEE